MTIKVKTPFIEANMRAPAPVVREFNLWEDTYYGLGIVHADSPAWLTGSLKRNKAFINVIKYSCIFQL